VDLVPAFSELAARHPQLRLVALNPGVPEKVLLGCFPEAVRPRVVYRKAQPEKGIIEAMADTDIYLLPSLFEGTPLTLIEAMFAGMPIVTTATCGMKDVIADGKTGLLVPIRDPQAIVNAVERLLGDMHLRARLGQAARIEALERYSWQKVADPLRQVYERLCSTP
jgi:glycosyltransferase involved in cell wall biosynthesis